MDRNRSLMQLFFIILLFAGIVFSIGMPDVARAARSCPFSGQTGRTIAYFSGSVLISNGTGVNETTINLSTQIPTGTYDIRLASYDSHSQDGNFELYEQWYAVLKNSSGSSMGTSESVVDIPNEQDSVDQIVNSNFRIIQPITSITAVHSQAFDSNPNSVVPVCAAFDAKDSRPQVTTNVATLINETAATLNGYVDPVQPTDTVRWFDWGLSPYLGFRTQDTVSATPGNVSQRIFGLQKNTTYYFRVSAKNYAGTESGTVLSFTTGAGPQYTPFVSTNPTSNISGTSATLNGNEIAGNSSDTVHWFEWGETSSLGIRTPEVAHDPSRLTFFENISGLSPGTTYYVKAFARNSLGTTEGSLLSFKAGPFSTFPLSSPSPVPSSSPTPTILAVFTKSPTSIEQTAAVLNGSVIADTGVNTDIWFEWGTQPALGNQTSRTTLGQISNKDFSARLSGLNAGSLYYFRAVAENTRGKNYGTTFLFRTALLEKKIPVTSVKKTSAILPAPPKPPARTQVFSQGLIALTIAPSRDTVVIGTPVQFTITAENKSKKLLKEVLLTVTLPPELSYRQLTTSIVGMEKKISVVNQVISIPLGDFIVGDKATFVVEAIVKSDTIDKKIFTTVAEITYIEPETNIEGKETAFAVNTAIRANTSFAALLFAGGLWTWLLFGFLGLLLLILLILLILCSRRCKEDKEEKKNKNSNRQYTES